MTSTKKISKSHAKILKSCMRGRGILLQYIDAANNIRKYSTDLQKNRSQTHVNKIDKETKEEVANGPTALVTTT